MALFFKVSLSEFGMKDEEFETVEEAKARLSRRGHKRFKVGRWSAWKASEHYGKEVLFSVAKWWEAGGNSENYSGKLVRCAEVL